ncbi:SRPBCC domain-containing protein [Rhodococcus sp. IEGM 1409]|uniref:SRPBCC domain-containing protein n=1 Tax=Rhodococcus sp. IEGM 1409 TaxID=3047082 RepID=UPI0024B656C1|nr:SRPBCC domain-containing protein [Rhodococcus sp. IEGM 1409]MDI9900872.1 SRPBCC domain-containing protein [Rhodococcus sp. IEGM 1409]
MSENFEIRREVVVPGTPEQIWAAIAAETAGWMFPSPLEIPADGSRPDSPIIATWEPPSELAIHMQGPDGWFNNLEYVVEARDESTAVVRYVHAGVFAEDWDNQYDGASKHTDFYLHSLGQYVQYFAGRPTTYVAAEGPEASSAPDAMDTLRGALGIARDTTVDDTLTVNVPGIGTIEAIVDYVDDWFIGLRTDNALLRFYGRNAFGGNVDAAHHLFAADADADAATAAWRAWLAGVFA